MDDCRVELRGRRAAQLQDERRGSDPEALAVVQHRARDARGADPGAVAAVQVAHRPERAAPLHDRVVARHAGASSATSLSPSRPMVSRSLGSGTSHVRSGVCTATRGPELVLRQHGHVHVQERGARASSSLLGRGNIRTRLEAKYAVAHVDDVARHEESIGRPLAVDAQTVGRTEVHEREAAIRALHARMQARHRVVVQHEVARGVAPDRGARSRQRELLREAVRQTRDEPELRIRRRGHPERSRGICTRSGRDVQIPRLAPLARDDIGLAALARDDERTVTC